MHITTEQAAALTDIIARHTGLDLEPFRHNTPGFTGPGFALIQKAAADEHKRREAEAAANHARDCEENGYLDCGVSHEDGESVTRWYRYESAEVAESYLDGWAEAAAYSRQTCRFGGWFLANVWRDGAVLITVCAQNV